MKEWLESEIECINEKWSVRKDNEGFGNECSWKEIWKGENIEKTSNNVSSVDQRYHSPNTMLKNAGAETQVSAVSSLFLNQKVQNGC